MDIFKHRHLQTGHIKSGGYSLVETLIYIALFVTLSAVLIGSLVGMVRAYTVLRVNDDLLDSAHVSLERMTREIRNATAIDPASVLGSSLGTLTLDTLDSGGAPKTITFDVSSGVLRINDSTDGTARSLTGSKVAVTSFIARSVTMPHGAAVRIEVVFTSLRNPRAQPLSLSDTVVLRATQ